MARDLEELKEDVRSAAERVYEELQPLGPSELSEGNFRDALAIELRREGIEFEREKPVGVRYKGEFLTEKDIDLIVGMDQDLGVELKQTSSGNITESHETQLKYYLSKMDTDHGMLINFGKDELSFRSFPVEES